MWTHWIIRRHLQKFSKWKSRISLSRCPSTFPSLLLNNSVETGWNGSFSHLKKIEIKFMLVFMHLRARKTIYAWTISLAKAVCVLFWLEKELNKPQNVCAIICSFSVGSIKVNEIYLYHDKNKLLKRFVSC